MPNVLRGETALPNTDFVLRFDVNALCEVEAATGGNILITLAALEDGTPPSFTTIRLLLWAGLRAGGRTQTTVGEAGDILQAAGLQSSLMAIAEAMAASLDLKADGAPGKNP